MTSATATRTPAPSRAPGIRDRRGIRARTLAPYLFVLPNMAIFGLFVIWPAINGFNVSFYDSPNGRTFEWVGLENYTRIANDAEFWQVLGTTLLFTVAFGVLAVTLSVTLAALLDAQIRAKGFFRAVFFLPALLSPVVVGLVWSELFDRQTGLVNGALAAIGLPEPGWLVSPGLALGVVVFVGLWSHVGFYTMILVAGLQGIDRSVYEAASLDGASPVQQFFRMTLPLLAPTTMVVVVLSTVNGFQSYDYIVTLTGGGPIGSTTLLVQYVYDNAFRSPISYGTASAGGVVLFLVIFAITLVNFLVGRRREAM